MRLGYFGGTFDPPHLGHLAVAREAADAFALDRVLLVPTASQPLKPNGATASYQDRFAMISLLCCGDPRCEASDLEAPEDPAAPNYTIDTLTRLRRSKPDAELYVIVGADAFHDLPRWRSPDKLIEIAEWIVVTRPHVASASQIAVELPPLTASQRERVHLLQTFDHPASSTSIRSDLQSGSLSPDELTPEILAYIRSHHLYE
jgi:nicotinate-nucleotide adenylyltransferase